MLALGDGYDVARSGRRLRARGYGGGTADRQLDYSRLTKLREICRDADRNSPLLHGIIERWADNVVGPSFELQPATEDDGWNAAARQYVEERMGRSADIRRKLVFRRMVRLWLRSLSTDGDILPVFTDQGMRTFEADQLISPHGRAPEGKNIINGVHVDPATGRDLGYYVGKRTYRGFAGKEFEDAATYIPATDAIFPANYERVSQTRGVPILTSAMKVFEHFDGYLDAEQIAAEVNSNLTYFIKRAKPEFWVDENGNLPNWVQAEIGDDGTEQQLRKSEPGAILTGDVGDELDMLNPGRPSESFEPYVIITLRMIGCGIGMPLELVLLDFSKTNYSSARASLLQAYRTFRCWQRFAIDEMLNPVYMRWIGQAIVECDLTLRDDAFAVGWLMPRWARIDPLKEILAAEKAVSMGIDTLEDYIERERQTLGDYVTKRSRELKAFRDAGIPTTTAPNNAPGDEGPDADGTDKDGRP